MARMPVRETDVGELGPLAREAMLRRMDSTAVQQRAQALLPQEGLSRAVHAPRTDQREQVAQPLAQADPRADLSAEQQTRPLQITALFPHQRVPTDRRAPAGEVMGQTRRELGEVRTELRNLRAEIATLSRMLGRPVRESPAFKGIIQQHDQQDTDVRTDAFQEARAARRARATAALERRTEQELALAQVIRRNELKRISERQQELLMALRRAEQRLNQAADNLPAGMRDSLIGEIYRARYNIALFGGTQALTLLSGLQFNATA
jgi:hypothetical protein